MPIISKRLNFSDLVATSNSMTSESNFQSSSPITITIRLLSGEDLVTLRDIKNPQSVTAKDVMKMVKNYCSGNISVLKKGVYVESLMVDKRGTREMLGHFEDNHDDDDCIDQCGYYISFSDGNSDSNNFSKISLEEVYNKAVSKSESSKSISEPRSIVLLATLKSHPDLLNNTIDGIKNCNNDFTLECPGPITKTVFQEMEKAAPNLDEIDMIREHCNWGSIGVIRNPYSYSSKIGNESADSSSNSTIAATVLNNGLGLGLGLSRTRVSRREYLNSLNQRQNVNDHNEDQNQNQMNNNGPLSKLKHRPYTDSLTQKTRNELEDAIRRSCIRSYWMKEYESIPSEITTRLAGSSSENSTGANSQTDVNTVAAATANNHINVLTQLPQKKNLNQKNNTNGNAKSKKNKNKKVNLSEFLAGCSSEEYHDRLNNNDSATFKDNQPEKKTLFKDSDTNSLVDQASIVNNVSDYHNLSVTCQCLSSNNFIDSEKATDYFALSHFSNHLTHAWLAQRARVKLVDWQSIVDRNEIFCGGKMEEEEEQENIEEEENQDDDAKTSFENFNQLQSDADENDTQNQKNDHRITVTRNQDNYIDSAFVESSDSDNLKESDFNLKLPLLSFDSSLTTLESLESYTNNQILTRSTSCGTDCDGGYGIESSEYSDNSPASSKDEKLISNFSSKSHKLPSSANSPLSELQKKRQLTNLTKVMGKHLKTGFIFEFSEKNSNSKTLFGGFTSEGHMCVVEVGKKLKENIIVLDSENQSQTANSVEDDDMIQLNRSKSHQNHRRTMTM